MDVPEHIAGIRTAGDLMAKAIEAVGATATIPTCPEWTMRDLALHQGEVHRWARTIVANGLAAPPEDDFLGPLPDDAGLVDWFREGHESLVTALSAADPALECWAFMAGPSPLAFWARRQCHETTIHRVDAESATGSIAPIAADVAADGVDELLTGFVTRKNGKLRSDTPRTLAVRATDTGDAWLVRVGAEEVVTERAEGDAECTIAAGASDLDLFLWNRLDRDAVDVNGDASLLDLWRTSVTIRWG
jgi:uncharacterized protein (TIGR03083 family)